MDRRLGRGVCARDSIGGMEAGGQQIEVVWGDLGDRADWILAFWKKQGALEGEEARERLDEVVCLSLDDAGEVTGVNSVREETIPLVQRSFWVYRSLLPGGSAELATRMFAAAFDALEERFDRDAEAPLGLCVMVRDRGEMEQRPEAVWRDTELTFAGYASDERQVRIRYFWGAKIGPGLPTSPSIEQHRDVDYSLEERYRIEPLAETSAVTPDDVLALWEREGAVSGEDAQRRVHEVRLVAYTEADGELAGISTVFLERNAQLRMDMWSYRTFVAAEHRMSNLAAQLIIRNRDELEARFESGEDTRAQGLIFDLENEGMQKHLNNAYWPPSDFTFIGENKHGHHRRVHYFPGAHVSLPATTSGYH
jgi:hypothetical protein